MPDISSSITFAGRRCILSVPEGTRAVGRATSITDPVGHAPTRAWVLMAREELASVTENESGTLRWEWGDRVLEFPGLYINSRERIRHGGVGDAEAVFLVELVDARYIAAKHSDVGLVAANHRSYAQTNDDENERAYLEGTRGQTWGSLASTLWDSAGVLGAFPGLPFEPDWRPEQQRFAGTSGYRALCEFLDFLDCAICRNPLTNAYTIIALGAAQDLPDHTISLKWDGEVKNYPATHAAATVNAYFPTHYRSYGQENDTPQEDNWADVKYAEQRGLATNINGAIGAIPRWQDLPRVFSKTNQDANLGRRQLRTENVRDRYTQRVTVPKEHKVYLGLIDDILPGARVRAVQWRHFGDAGGTETEYFSGPNLPNDIGAARADLTSVCDLQPTENYAAADLARRSYPNYPRLPNIVQIAAVAESASEEDPAAGTTVQPDSDGLHKARVKRWVGGQMTTIEDCYVLFVDDYDNNQGQVSAIQGEYYGPARLSGIAGPNTDERPLYLVRSGAGDAIIFFELYENLNLGGSALAYVLRGDGDGWVNPIAGDPQVTVQDPYNEGMWQGFTGYRGFARKHPTSDRYDILFMEEIAKFVYYQLQQELPDDNSGAAAATLVYKDGKNPGLNITVFEPAVGGFYWRRWHAPQCEGWAVWNDFFRRYEITTPQLVCKFIRAQLYQPICSLDSNAPMVIIETIEHLPQGYYSFKQQFVGDVAMDGEDEVHVMQVTNPRDHKGRRHADVLLMGHNDGIGGPITWEIVDMELHKVSVVTGISLGSCRINTQTQEIFVETCGDTGNGEPILLSSVTLVEDVVHTSDTGEPSCTLYKQTNTYCVFPTLTESTIAPVIDFTAQPALEEIRINSGDTAIEGFAVPVWTPCVTAGEWVDLIDLTECAGGPSSVDGGTY